MKEKILIVEDQFVEANNLQEILEAEGYYVCGIAGSVPKALKLIEDEKPDLVLLDISLRGPLTGIDLAKSLRVSGIPFIYLSANSDTKTLESAKATFPYGFLVKPFRQKDVLVMLEIARYLHDHNLEAMQRKGSIQESQFVSKSGNADPITTFPGIIGMSQKLKTVLDHLQIVAPTGTSVLILGESGTGKEKIAELIHQYSPRRSKPMIKVNCAALPPSLVESELFGHERGSFTGATEKRIGKFEQADKGTIFLDEIGELPLDVQVKFLRVLQEKEIERIGGNETIRIDVRIISATNSNLEREVAAGRFRMDLYYRLNVFPLLLPPLRERKEDIPLLAGHFVSHYASIAGKRIRGISDKVINTLLDHDWPGNVRELQHSLERAVLMCQGNEITSITMPEVILTESLEIEKPIKTIDEVEREHILFVLKQCNGKVSGKGGAAELLGINVSTLNSKMKKLGIDKGEPKFFKPSNT